MNKASPLRWMTAATVVALAVVTPAFVAPASASAAAAPEAATAITAGAPAAPAAASAGAPAMATVDEEKALPTVTAEPLSTWQTNGVVYAVETVGNVVYAGGNFSSVRPAGSAEGQNEVARKNIAAFDATTGALLPFSHKFEGDNYPIPFNGVYDKTCSPGTEPNTYTCDTVYEIRASKDGSKLYVGGDFVRVDGQGRTNLASFDTGSNVLNNWSVNDVRGRVRSLTVGTNNTVYFGGSFSQVDGQSRSRLAAADATSGALLPWSPTADDLVLAMEMSPDNSRVILGGQFMKINSTSIHGIATVASDSGSNMPWSSRVVPNASYITDLSVAGDTVYASSNGEGTWDGRMAATINTGAVVWKDDCLGATWAIEVAGDLVYSGSHAHDCSMTSGGFPESVNGAPAGTARWYRLLAQTRSGSYAKHIQHWFPTTNGGIVGKLGPRDLTWTGNQLWVGGEFTTVNGAPQQGLTRFAPPPAARAKPIRPDTPTATSPRIGQVTVNFRATEDIDDQRLTYNILRGPDTGSMTKVGSMEADSKPWSKSALSYTDTTAEPGATYVYQVQAVDASGATSTKSFPVTVTVVGPTDAYSAAVYQDRPTLYWRLDDPSRSTRVSSLSGPTGSVKGEVSLGVTGALTASNNTAARFAKGSWFTSDGYVVADESFAAPNTFTAEVWFKTSTGGGRLLGFGDGTGTSSGSRDRTVYMGSDGKLNFGVNPSGTRVITTPNSYRDGQWHHLAATLGADGMKLYVDGALAASRADTTSGESYTGRWRIGADSVSGWPNANGAGFAGDLDEFAIYDKVLSADTIAAHKRSGSIDNVAPSIPGSAKASAFGRTVNLSWGASTDNVGVTGYQVHRVATAATVPSDATLLETVTGTSYTHSNAPIGKGYYKVVAVDADGNKSAASNAAEVDVLGPNPYGEAVMADSPSLYWPLNDPAGSGTVSSVVGQTGTVRSGTTLGRESVLSQGTGATVNGTSNGIIHSNAKENGPQTFTAEIWVKTSTTKGGRIMGYSSSQTGSSTYYDRNVYMRNDGRIAFVVEPSWLSTKTVTSTAAFNDGKWHQVTASLGSSGMRLYVDGNLVGSHASTRSAESFSGYWRLGGDRVYGNASSNYIDAALDEFAVYPSQLSDQKVAGHFAAASVVVTPPDTTAPVSPGVATAKVNGNDVTLDWAEAMDDTGVTGYLIYRLAAPNETPEPSALVGATKGSTTTFTDTGVPDGTWYYKVTARDGENNISAPSSASVAVAVGAIADVEVSPKQGTWVDSTNPTKNYGNAWAMTVDGDPQQLAYLHFDLPATPAGRTLTGAKLRLTTTTNAWSGSADPVEVRLSDGTPWTQSGLNWENHPQPTGPVLGTVKAGNADTTYETELSIDSLAQVTGGTLVLSDPGTDNLQLVSHLGAAGKRPVLVLSYS